jgi:exopolysaccharide production protein ExoQ
VIVWRPTIEHFWRWLEHAYVVALIFTLTQGPVYKIWRTAEFYTPVPIAPTWQATFLAVQIPALMLLARRGLTRDFLRGPFLPLAGLLVWMMASTTWTNLSRYASVESLALTVTAGAGLYVGSRFTSRQLVVLISIAMQLGVVLSYLAVKRTWTEAIDGEGNWTGIYFNRNSLGPVAMLGLITSLAIATSLWRARHKPYRLHLFVMASVFVVLDLVVYVRSGSSTSIGAAVVAGSVSATWIIVGKWHKKTDAPLLAIQRIVYPAFVFVTLLIAWVGFRYQTTIVGWFGKADFFNGRSALWHYSWTGFLDRPFLGWGWRAAWSTPEFLKRDLWWTTTGASWSHNGFLEVLLGGGIFGGLLFTGFVLWAGRRTIATVVSIPSESWRVGMAMFVLVACTQEVFIIGNHFLWLLLVAVLTPQSVTKSAQPRASDSHLMRSDRGSRQVHDALFDQP